MVLSSLIRAFLKILAVISLSLLINKSLRIKCFVQDNESKSVYGVIRGLTSKSPLLLKVN